MYTSAHYINIISTNQMLTCTILFQAVLVYLSPPNDMLWSTVDKQWR